MIVVHAFVTAAGGLALWAEASTEWGLAVRRSTQAMPHPFAVPPPVEGTAQTATLLLPSTKYGPVASPELCAPELTVSHHAAGIGGEGGVRTLPWTVPAVLLPPGTNPEALLDPAGHRAGASIGHLSDIVGFAADLTRRGRVLPGVVEDPAGGVRAQWRAALYGVDHVRFADLVRSNPGVTLAGGASSAQRALRGLLDAEIDHRVRERLVASLVPGGQGEGATHAWLRALTGPRSTFEADPEEARWLLDRLDDWHDSAVPAALRLCFRLTYVEEGREGHEQAVWLLEFLLQPLADPSVLVPARHVWSESAAPLLTWIDLDPADRRGTDPQEILLGDLGRASRLYPDLDDALHERQPTEMALDVAGAYRFLTHAALLTEAGFGVLVPATWQRPTDLGFTLTLHTRQATSAVLRDQTANRDAIVDYRWGLALGAEPLTESDLHTLARAKVPLVRLRGRWVYLDSQQLTAGLAFLARGGCGQMTAGEALRLVRLIPDPQQPLPLTGIDGSGWLADLLAGRAEERLVPLDPPAWLAATLRPYQRKGLSWLAFLDRLGVGALLADDMGLGKTIQVLALEALLRERGPRPPTLIVCPLSVLGNWQREIERFTPTLTVHVHHGAARELPDTADLVLTTYNLATRDAKALGSIEWDRVVLDEAQHVKNSASATARAIRGVSTRHRVALTGTPVENRLTELWSIMDFLNPGLLGRVGTFR